MWNRLDTNKRKMVAIALAIAVFYVAYRFSFSHAIEAYTLNGKLKREAGLQSEDAAYPHLNKKYMFYQKVLRGYEVKQADLETKLWQDVSGMAIAQQVKISYDPSRVSLDTTANKRLHSLQFGFRGDFFNLVKLMDTIGRSKRIGRISKVSIGMKKELSSVSGKPSDLTIDLTLNSLEK